MRQKYKAVAFSYNFVHFCLLAVPFLSTYPGQFVPFLSTFSSIFVHLHLLFKKKKKIYDFTKVFDCLPAFKRLAVCGWKKSKKQKNAGKPVKNHFHRAAAVTPYKHENIENLPYFLLKFAYAGDYCVKKTVKNFFFLPNNYEFSEK